MALGPGVRCRCSGASSRIGTTGAPTAADKRARGAGRGARPQTASSGWGAARKRACPFLPQATDRPVACASVGVDPSGCWSQSARTSLRSALMRAPMSALLARRGIARRGVAGPSRALYPSPPTIAVSTRRLPATLTGHRVTRDENSSHAPTHPPPTPPHRRRTPEALSCCR
jgi:hypothetical protein